MRLKKYLMDTRKPDESKGERYARFARDLKVSVHTVLKWLNKERGIRDKIKIRIQEVTEGRVKIKDMMG